MIFLNVSLPQTEVLEVGPNKAYSRIESAVQAAKNGDTIRVFPDPSNYARTAVMVTKKLKIVSAVSTRIQIDGSDFEYSGSGKVPRAIFQIEPEASGTVISGFDLSGAHNLSFNGAGIRIQAANQVQIDNCSIHDNDMGIMSNGSRNKSWIGRGQRISYSSIFRNGSLKDPGYNHNLYLGGDSVKLFRCDIHHSLTGHNLKSRAHFLMVEECYIHDAANREIDLPEAEETKVTNSNVVIISSRIVKDPNCTGNRGVIHFGQEKPSRVGTLYLFNNVIVSPYASPFILVTSDLCSLDIKGNVFISSNQARATLWSGTSPGQKAIVESNGFSAAFANVGPKNTIAIPPKSIYEVFDIRNDGTYLPIPNSSLSNPKNFFNFVDGDGKTNYFSTRGISKDVGCPTIE